MSRAAPAMPTIAGPTKGSVQIRGFSLVAVSWDSLPMTWAMATRATCRAR